MKSQIIFLNRGGGFMMVEVMIAFSIFIIFTISIFTLDSSMKTLKIWSINELEKMEKLVKETDSGINLVKSRLGNDSYIYSNEMFSFTQSDYKKSFGRSSCDPRLTFTGKVTKYLSGIDIGTGNYSTDIEVRNDIVYLSADSNTVSLHDLYIIDNTDPVNPYIMSSINTGPGISAIEVVGPYIFAAQASTVNQLQVIDIRDRNNPKLISQLKLPLPTATTTASIATSITYSDGYIYLGTTKWNGREFNVIDISNTTSPTVVGSFETNTLINDIYVEDTMAYIAASDEKQMRVVDITNMSLVNSYSPSGWQTQEGKVIDMFEGNITFGRTVGGFNVVNNHEIFVYGTTTNISKDVPGGVYGVLRRAHDTFVLTHSVGRELQILDSTTLVKKYETTLESSPVRMACDMNNIYFATGNIRGMVMIKIENE